MDQGTLQGIGTIFALLAFIGVGWWTFISHKKHDFDEAANAPFEGEEIAEQLAVKAQQDRQDIV